jgi:hypothetical protein
VACKAFQILKSGVLKKAGVGRAEVHSKDSMGRSFDYYCRLVRPPDFLNAY